MAQSQVGKNGYRVVPSLIGHPRFSQLEIITSTRSFNPLLVTIHHLGYTKESQNLTPCPSNYYQDQSNQKGLTSLFKFSKAFIFSCFSSRTHHWQPGLSREFLIVSNFTPLQNYLITILLKCLVNFLHCYRDLKEVHFVQSKLLEFHLS